MVAARERDVASYDDYQEKTERRIPVFVLERAQTL